MEVYIAVKHASFGDTWQVDLKGKWRAEDLLKLTKQFKDSTRSNDTLFISETEKRLFEEWLLDLLSTEDANVRLLSIRTTQIFRNGWQHLKAISDMKPSASLDKFLIAMPTDDDAIPSPVFDAIANNWHIRSLELTCHSEDDWNALAYVLLHNPSITSCNILPCKKWHAKSRFFEALAKNQTLKKLQIQARPISAAEINNMNHILEVNTTLEELELINNEPNAIALFPNKTLKSLKHKLPSTLESTEEYERFCTALLLKQSLTRLELINGNQVVNPTIVHFQNKQGLKVLSLEATINGSLITPELVSVLKDHCSITDLTLSSPTSKIGDILKVNKKITKLKLTGELFQKTVSDVCQSLYENDTLTSLTLDGFGFGEVYNLNKKFNPYSKLLAKNKTLQVLSVTGMSVNELVLVLNTNSNLRSITIGCTNANNNGQFKMIEKALSNNSQLLSCKITENKMTARSAKTFKFIDGYITRNRNLYLDAAIIVHNIRRSDLFQLMPSEMWTHIFSLMGHPYDKHWAELLKHDK